MFRVQGGILPNASKVRFVLDDAGKIAIQGDDMLFINVNQQTRALEFLAKRSEGASLVQFQRRKGVREEKVSGLVVLGINREGRRKGVRTRCFRN